MCVGDFDRLAAPFSFGSTMRSGHSLGDWRCRLNLSMFLLTMGCSILPIFYYGKRSHALVTQCVRVRACKNPRRGREETRWRLFVPTDMSPCYRNSPMHTKCKDQERTRKVLCAWSPQPDKICTHTQTCQRNMRRRRNLWLMQLAECCNKCSGTGACVPSVAAGVAGAAAVQEVTHWSR